MMNIPLTIVNHRANLFSAICQITSNEISEVMAQRAKFKSASNGSFGSLLQFPERLSPRSRQRPKIIGKSLIFGSKSLDLSAAPMTLELYKTFLENPQHRANKFEIAERVYGIKNPREKSERYWSATKLNITKLISRSRKQAAEYFAQDAEDISWFSYNSIEDAWELYTIRGLVHPDWHD